MVLSDSIWDQIDAVITHLETKHPATTVRTYRYALHKFGCFLFDYHEVGATEYVTVDHFIGFAEMLADTEHNYSAQTRTVCNSAAKHLLDWLVIKGVLEPTATEIVRYQSAIKEFAGKVKRVPKLPKAEHVDWVVAAAVQASADQPSNLRLARDAAMLLFLRATGCRGGELVTLTVGDVDLYDATATVVGKGDKVRTAFFDKATALALQHYWGVRAALWPKLPFKLAFMAARVAPINTGVIREAVTRARCLAGKSHVELYGIKLTPHMFRHLFATEVLERTGNLAATQDLLGHASPETTRIYAQLSKASLRAAYDKGTER